MNCRKRKAISVVLLAAVLIISGCGSEEAAPMPQTISPATTAAQAATTPFAQQEAVFADPVIAEMLRGYFAPDFKITAGALTELTRLDRHISEFAEPGLEAREVATLDDLALLPNLTVLSLNNCSLESLKGIEVLTKLEELYISGNSITDLSPLAKLASLRVLDCTANKITDLSPLAGLSKLEQISFGYNQVADIALLEGFPALHTVYADGNPIPQSALARYVAERDDKYTLMARPIGGQHGLPELELRVIGVREPFMHINGYEYGHGMERIVIADAQTGEAVCQFYVPDISSWGDKPEITDWFDLDDEYYCFKQEDMNFDGYPDFALYDWTGGKFVRQMRFLWNAHVQKYEYNAALSELFYPTFDAEARQIRTYLPSGVASFGEEIFYYDGKALVMDSEHFYSAVYWVDATDVLAEIGLEGEAADAVIIVEVTQYFPGHWTEYRAMDGWIGESGATVLYVWTEAEWQEIESRQSE